MPPQRKRQSAARPAPAKRIARKRIATGHSAARDRAAACSAARRPAATHAAAKAPPVLRCGGGAATVLYRRIPDHHAVHRRVSGAAAARAVLVLEGGRIAVFRAAAGMPRAGSGKALGPVYRLEPGGALAVPTGLVLVRFREGASARESSADIARAGYRIASVLEYAPHAAWVRTAKGGIEDSLRSLAALRALPGVECVEPQMLMARTLRAAPSGRGWKSRML